jgi:flagellar motility protein MotE (MotC chaperone)
LRLFPVLIVVAAASLAVKTGDIWQGVGALAQESTPTAETVPAEVKAEVSEGAAAPATMTPGADPVGSEPEPASVAALSSDPFALTDEEIELLQQLAERRAEIDRRAAELDQRRVLLEAAEKRIDEKVAELESLKKVIEELLILQDVQEQRQLDSLVKIYESMKPKDAARIFGELDMVVLLDVIERMKERKIAPILAEMNPQRAKAITIELAQRRGLPEQSGQND